MSNDDVRAILLDIEGTTSSIAFVKEQLFPFARRHIPAYVRDHAAELHDLLNEVARIEGEMDAIGLPHPRANGAFPRVIARYVKARQVLTLEDAVRKMTSWPASRMRLHDRGAIRQGLWADVTIFNYDRLNDVATYQDPTAYPTGIDYVLVNGEVVVDQGQHTGAKPGMVLRGQGYTTADR